MEGAEPGGFLGRAPAWGRHCLCSGDRDSTAHTQQCCMQTELWEGGNKILDFFFNFFFPSPCLAGAPQRRRCMAEGSWRALSLSSQPRRCPLPAVTGARVGEPSHDKPSRGPAVNDGSCPSLPGLETPLSTRWLNMRLGPPCIMCWLNKGEGLAGLSGEA